MGYRLGTGGQIIPFSISHTDCLMQLTWKVTHTNSDPHRIGINLGALDMSTTTSTVTTLNPRRTRRAAPRVKTGCKTCK